MHGASQDGKQPLHYAVAKGVPLDVTELLLEANPKAATSKDKARSSAHTAPPTAAAPFAPSCFSPVSSRNPPRNTAVLRHAPRTQGGKLPLHYAAAKGAPLDVMKLLLDANLEATTSRDEVCR